MTKTFKVKLGENSIVIEESPVTFDYCPGCDSDVEFENCQAVNGEKFMECKECRHQISE